MKDMHIGSCIEDMYRMLRSLKKRTDQVRVYYKGCRKHLST